MLRRNKHIGYLSLLMIFTSCGIYSFMGASIPPGIKTFQVNDFENRAGSKPGSTFEPGLDRDFTLALQDLLLNQTKLNLAQYNGDLIYEGEIIEYSVKPMSATAEMTAAQNRLTMTVALRFFNTKKEEDDLEKKYSFFFDFPAERQLYEVKDEALKEIFERITQDIFNDTLAKW